MRTLSALVAALALTAVPVLVATPAQATGTVICVNYPVPAACGSTQASISAAIAASGTSDTILVGPGTYSDGPYSLQGTHAATLQGSGTSTVITLPASAASQTYLYANGTTIRHLKVVMNATSSSNDTGVSGSGGATIEDVTVDGTGVSNAVGLHVGNTQVSGATISMPAADSRAAYGEGASTITNSSLTGGGMGFVHSATGTPDVLSRVTIHTAGSGVSTDVGSVNIDDSVIDLGSSPSAKGLQTSNFNNSTVPISITADHLTIDGGGAGSRGVWAYASTATVKQTSTITLSNSIVRGPATSLVADAGNNGAQGGASKGQITVDHTDYETKGGTIGANGTGGVVLGSGNVVDVDPQFVSATDLHLTSTSPVIDAGDPAAGPATDRDGHPRVADGDGNGSAISDLGAYELADLIPPQTTITSGPATRTRDTTPSFTFASEPGATFACQVDASAYTPCTSPFTTAALANGSHTVRVRATDTASNTDASPATRSFVVDTVAPSTRITKAPAKKVSSKMVGFKFTSTEVGSTFQCRLDGGAWKRCASPRAITVAKGAHVFRVRAVDVAGNVDKTPAVSRFTRK